MKCLGACPNTGICNNRQGRVLSQAEWLAPDTLPDREVCKWKRGADCEFSLRNQPSNEQSAATKAMMAAGEELN